MFNQPQDQRRSLTPQQLPWEENRRLIKGCADLDAALALLRRMDAGGRFAPEPFRPTGTSIIILKPDCYLHGLDSIIPSLFKGAGFSVEPLGEVRFTSAHTLQLWTDNFQALWEWRANTKHLCSRPGDAFALTGPGGVEKVLEIKRELRKLFCDPADVFVRLIHCPDSDLELERNLHFLRAQYPGTPPTEATDPEQLWGTLVKHDPLAAELAQLNLPVDVYGGWTIGAHRAGAPIDLICHVPERMIPWLSADVLDSPKLIECGAGSCILSIVPSRQISEAGDTLDQQLMFRYRTLRYFGEGSDEVRQSVAQSLERWRKALPMVIESGFRSLAGRARKLTEVQMSAQDRSREREEFKHTAMQLLHNLYGEPSPPQDLISWSLLQRFPQSGAAFTKALQQVEESNAGPAELQGVQRALAQIAGLRGYTTPSPPIQMYGG